PSHLRETAPDIASRDCAPHDLCNRSAQPSAHHCTPSYALYLFPSQKSELVTCYRARPCSPGIRGVAGGREAHSDTLDSSHISSVTQASLVRRGWSPCVPF